MKRCFKCLCEKPLEAFYKHAAMADGRLGKCKECTKNDAKEHRQQNLEKVRAYDRLRGSMPHRVAARRDYMQTAEGKDAHRRALVASALRHPERQSARNKLAKAIRTGKVIPWPVCAVPECDRTPQAHHADYSRPLDVVWLCASHHHQAHAAIKEI